MSDTIFCSIASFRDPELIPTLESLISHAKYPENIHFTIFLQNGTNEPFEIDQLKDYRTDPRFTILEIPHDQTKGTCWARATIQDHFTNEDWYLQLDSHHRFVRHWDQICIEMIKELQTAGYSKPVLTTYLPSYNPFNDPEGRAPECWRLDWDRFIPESPFFILPSSMTEEEMKTPLLSRYFSGHFVFAPGSYVKEVPYDPNLFFHGEESSMSVRSWTWGYDLFCPNQQIAFHEYTRDYRKGLKVWDGNSRWVELNKKSHERHRKLFEMDGVKNDIDFGKYGLGPVRSLAAYEKFSGIRFRDRSVQRWTLEHKPPPNPNDHWKSEEEYNNSFEAIFRHCIDIHKSQLPLRDYDFLAVIFKDSHGNEIFRKDAVESEISMFYQLLETKEWVNLWREFHMPCLPTTWVVWPHSKSQGWSPSPLEGKLIDTIS